MNDLRDPTHLGEMLEQIADLDRRSTIGRKPLSKVYDDNAAMLQLVAAHDANPSCVEKYGFAQGDDPRFAGAALAEAA